MLPPSQDAHSTGRSSTSISSSHGISSVEINGVTSEDIVRASFTDFSLLSTDDEEPIPPMELLDVTKRKAQVNSVLRQSMSEEEDDDDREFSLTLNPDLHKIRAEQIRNWLEFESKNLQMQLNLGLHGHSSDGTSDQSDEGVGDDDACKSFEEDSLNYVVANENGNSVAGSCFDSEISKGKRNPNAPRRRVRFLTDQEGNLLISVFITNEDEEDPPPQETLDPQEILLQQEIIDSLTSAMTVDPKEHNQAFEQDRSSDPTIPIMPTKVDNVKPSAPPNPLPVSSEKQPELIKKKNVKQNKHVKGSKGHDSRNGKTSGKSNQRAKIPTPELHMDDITQSHEISGFIPDEIMDIVDSSPPLVYIVVNETSDQEEVVEEPQEPEPCPLEELSEINLESEDCTSDSETLSAASSSCSSMIELMQPGESGMESPVRTVGQLINLASSCSESESDDNNSNNNKHSCTTHNQTMKPNGAKGDKNNNVIVEQLVKEIKVAVQSKVRSPQQEVVEVVATQMEEMDKSMPFFEYMPEIVKSTPPVVLLETGLQEASVDNEDDSTDEEIDEASEVIEVKPKGLPVAILNDIVKAKGKATKTGKSEVTSSVLLCTPEPAQLLPVFKFNPILNGPITKDNLDSVLDNPEITDEEKELVSLLVEEEPISSVAQQIAKWEKLSKHIQKRKASAAADVNVNANANINATRSADYPVNTGSTNVVLPKSVSLFGKSMFQPKPVVSSTSSSGPAFHPEPPTVKALQSSAVWNAWNKPKNADGAEEEDIYAQPNANTSPMMKSSAILKSHPKPNTRGEILNWLKDGEIQRSGIMVNFGPYHLHMGVATMDPSPGHSSSVLPWFFGLITRAQAEKFLHGQPTGTYLVRISTRIWGYTLSYQCNQRTKHFLISAQNPSTSASSPLESKTNQVTKSFNIMSAFQGQGQGRYAFIGTNMTPYSTLVSLIRHHTHAPITKLGGEKLLFPCPGGPHLTGIEYLFK